MRGGDDEGEHCFLLSEEVTGISPPFAVVSAARTEAEPEAAAVLASEGAPRLLELWRRLLRQQLLFFCGCRRLLPVVVVVVPLRRLPRLRRAASSSLLTS